MTASIQIAGRTIGSGAAPYIIAELGINHGGNVEMAHGMLESAAACGVDAVKLQTFATGQFLARSSAYFDVLASAELPLDALSGLVEHAARLGVTLFSAVFDEGSADLWARLGAPAYKIASGDLTHLPLLRHVAALGAPMVISTGGATVAEVARALEAVEDSRSGTPVALMHCVSHYPAAPETTNLACMATLRAAFGVPVGFSDHTVGIVTAVAAAALGAEVIEKHFTLDRALPGPDHALSADPADMKALVEAVKLAHAAVGSPRKAPVEAPDHVAALRRSLTAAVDIPANAVITRDMLAVKRPGTGIAPAEMGAVIGRRARTAIAADTTLIMDLLE